MLWWPGKKDTKWHCECTGWRYTAAVIKDQTSITLWLSRLQRFLSNPHLKFLWSWACADPESFFRGGPPLKTFLVDEWIQITLISGQHRPASEAPFNANDGLLLTAGLAALWFCRIRIRITKEPYIFFICQGGPDHLPPPPSGSVYA